MSRNHPKHVWSNTSIAINIVCLVAGVASSLYYLRSNNLAMIDLYKKVEAADVSGVDTYGQLKNLQSYVAGHMNATPPKLGSNPGIQLKNTYERAKKAETDRIANERTRIYNEAISYCEALLPQSLLSQRAQCIIDRNASQTVTEKQVVADLYRYDFVSPRWSADSAGWSVLASALLAGLLSLQILARAISRFLLPK